MGESLVNSTRGWNRQVLIVTVVTVAAALFFWNTRLLLPIKLFVVLLHEVSHALAALLTGGQVERLALTGAEGGLTFTRGGNRFLTLSAGYLGSALWGALFMRLAWSRPALRRLALRTMGGVLGLILLLYLRDLYSVAYVALAAAVLFALGHWGNTRLHFAALWIVGAFSALYAVIDIGTDILLAGPFAGIPLLGGPPRFNDAEMLASITFVPAFVWGLFWCALALAIFLHSVRTLART